MSRDGDEERTKMAPWAGRGGDGERPKRWPGLSDGGQAVRHEVPAEEMKVGSQKGGKEARGVPRKGSEEKQ